MAKLLDLNCDDTVHSYNLLTGTLALVEGTRQITPSEGVISETMDLISAVGSTDQNIIRAENEINEIGYLARQWGTDRSRTFTCWLEENAASETKRRALLKDCIVMRKEGANTSLLLGRQGVSLWTLYLSYRELWEPASAEALAFTTKSLWGGHFQATPSARLEGVLDGRISEAKASTFSASMGELWLGIRSPRESGVTLPDFTPVFELEYGTTLIADTTKTSEVGASPSGSSTNNRLTCTFATSANMADRVQLSVQQALTQGVGGSAVFTSMIGRYMVLLRAKVDSGTTARIRLYSGNTNGMRPFRDIDITNTVYRLIPIGEINIPSVSFRFEVGGSTGIAGNHLLKIGAERISGAGSLFLDALCLIPSDHLAYGKSASGSNFNWLSWYTFADDGVVAFDKSSGIDFEITNVVDYFMSNFFMPWSGGRCVLAGQSANPATVHSLTATASINLSHLARWKTFSDYA